MDNALTMAELAKTFGYSLAHLRRLSSQKKITSVKKEGHKLYFDPDTVKVALKHNVFKAQRITATNPLGLVNPKIPIPAGDTGTLQMMELGDKTSPLAPIFVMGGAIAVDSATGDSILPVGVTMAASTNNNS